MNIIENIERMRLGLSYSKRIDPVYRKINNTFDDVFKDFTYESETGQTLQMFCPIFACKFCNSPSYNYILGAANEDGFVSFMDTRHKKENIKTSHLAHNNAIFDLNWSNYGTKFVTASGDHTCVLWDYGEGEIRNILRFCCHSRTIKVVIPRPETDYMYVSGGRDGVIKFWDVRTGKDESQIDSDHTIAEPHRKPNIRIKHRRTKMPFKQDEDKFSVTGLIFQNENTLFSCSSGEGVIKAWDMRRLYTYRLHQPVPLATYKCPTVHSKNGFANLAISPCRTKLYGNCVSNVMYCYDIASQCENPIRQFQGHTVASYYLRNSVSPDGMYVASGSSDGHVYVWADKTPEKPLVLLKGHYSEVTCVDWCNTNEIKIATASDDATCRIWRPDFHDKDFLLGGQAEAEESDSEYPNIYLNSSYIKNKRACHIKDCPGAIKKRGIKRKFDSDSDILKSPVKHHKLQLTPIKESPTVNLPNLVIDGVSPHDHSCRRTPKNEVSDWLTKHRKSASKEKPKSSGQRRRSSSREPNAKVTLLKYFKCGSSSLTDIKLLPEEPINETPE